MSGIILTAGQNYFLNLAFKNQAPGDLYLGLHTKGDLDATDLDLQLGDEDFLEIVGTDYGRILIERDTDWVISSTGGVEMATSLQKTFTAGAGDWADVNGYFVAIGSVTGELDAIWAESFPVPQQGLKLEGDIIKAIAKFTLKDDSE